MQLREMIENAAKKVGEQKILAKAIGVLPNDLSAAKSGRRGLPVIACGKLAEILDMDRWDVVAASELVTERNEEKRAYLAPFVLGIAELATSTIASAEMKTAHRKGEPLNVVARGGIEPSTRGFSVRCSTN